jgi:hypothetical protein
MEVKVRKLGFFLEFTTMNLGIHLISFFFVTFPFTAAHNQPIFTVRKQMLHYGQIVTTAIFPATL